MHNSFTKFGNIIQNNVNRCIGSVPCFSIENVCVCVFVYKIYKRKGMDNSSMKCSRGMKRKLLVGFI